jgi:hypothetical protein
MINDQILKWFRSDLDIADCDDISSLLVGQIMYSLHLFLTRRPDKLDWHSGGKAK